ncbi:conserved protein of unknown function [Burkholderia multivorans]
MSEPSIKKPSKTAFHFPKNGSDEQAAEAKAADTKAAEAKAADAVKVSAEAAAKPASTKAAKKKRANGAEAAAEKATTEKAAPETKTKRQKKEKVIRDSFTMPKSDYEKIAALKQKCLEAGVSVKKSELLRAGLLMLEAAADKRLLAAVEAVETVKTGRPAKS